jgi:hypothetical protein
MEKPSLVLGLILIFAGPYEKLEVNGLLSA